MRRGKVKCDKCRGRGGWYRPGFLVEIWVPCLECRGKGAWYPNSKRKKKKEKP